MDTFSIMGAVGMVFGIMGFAFALDALKKINALEKQLKGKGMLPSID